MHRGCFTSRKTKAIHWQLGFRAKSMVICLALPQNPQIQTTNIGGSMGGARGILSVYAFQKLDCLLVRHFLRIFSPHWAKLLRLEKHIFLYLEVIRWFRVPWYYLPRRRKSPEKRFMTCSLFGSSNSFEKVSWRKIYSEKRILQREQFSLQSSRIYEYMAMEISPLVEMQVIL